MVELILYLGIIVIFILARIGNQLYRKATSEDPFAGYDKMWKFYVVETLIGLFLQGRIGSSDFIFKKTEDKKLQRLYLVVNILTALFYLAVIVEFTLMFLYRDQLPHKKLRGS